MMPTAEQLWTIQEERRRQAAAAARERLLVGPAGERSRVAGRLVGWLRARFRAGRGGRAMPISWGPSRQG